MATNARQLIGFAVAGAIVFLIASRAMKSTALVEAPPSLADSGGAASAPTASTATETPLSEDEKADRIAFGEAMAAAAKRLSPAMTVRFAADRFTVDWETGDLRGEYFLERSYREYAKLPAADRATYIDKRAASVGAPLVPATFAEAEAHVVPLVRERISYEMARIIAAADPLKALPPEPPHRELTGELWGVLGYETPEQFVRLDAPTLSRWMSRRPSGRIQGLSSNRS